MPNYVYSGFTVAGDRSELDRFRRMMFRPVTEADTGALPRTEMIFDFNGIIPMPPEGERQGYERWATEHWGTKWNAFDLDTQVSEDLIWFQFTTAWDFPTPVFEALAAEFPALVFAGSSYEDNGAFELLGEFNGANDWGPGEIEWASFDDDDDDAADDD
ncbi:hypothetical protein DAH66_17425 [Sphingomonas koreensis]|uniref:YubB ferredoxin-like domain-containing protein n=1 Tax=Sphingomonas koreensis TaxID=93064 RepID=A0A430G021_9SPHN|nr:hypothetical protein [Sphingomonas koreensis]RSY79346.1 hypothetical protein DAH66_17425 [Sphingomonas koreensis]